MDDKGNPITMSATGDDDHKDKDSALVQVTDTTYHEGVVEYHLDLILEVIISQ